MHEDTNSVFHKNYVPRHAGDYNPKANKTGHMKNRERDETGKHNTKVTYANNLSLRPNGSSSYFCPFAMTKFIVFDTNKWPCRDSIADKDKYTQ